MNCVRRHRLISCMRLTRIRSHWSHSKLNHSKLNHSKLNSIRMNRRYSLNVQVL
jgi:hypothetical protein